jgi:hypothetical protein
VSDSPASLHELRRANTNEVPWLVDVVLEELGGGRFSPADFLGLVERPDATALRVSGLDQAMFEELISWHGKQFDAIEFWKCPRITDLTPLESLPNLRLVSIWWNQRATRLWDMTKTPALTGLALNGFTRLHDLSDLATGGSLVELDIFAEYRVETLDPLAELRGLRSLALFVSRLADRRIEPLGSMTGLLSLYIRSNQFTTAQLAWLRARLPTVLSESLAPFQHSGYMGDPEDGITRDVQLNGKRKPLVSSVRDAKRIQKHVDEFNRMVAEFRANPDLLAD